MNNQSKIDLAVRLIEDGQGSLQRHVALRCDAYLDPAQARQLALQLLDMVDIIEPVEDRGEHGSY